MTKKNRYSTRIFEPKTIKVMKVNIHVHFHRSCESCFPVSFAKLRPKKVDLHRSLKVNCDHYIQLYFSVTILTSNISSINFAEESL